MPALSKGLFCFDVFVDNSLYGAVVHEFLQCCVDRIQQGGVAFIHGDGIVLSNIFRFQDLQTRIGLYQFLAGALSTTTQSTCPFISACTAVMELS